MEWIVKISSGLLVTEYIQVENNLLVLKKIHSLDRGQTWCYLASFGS